MTHLRLTLLFLLAACSTRLLGSPAGPPNDGGSADQSPITQSCDGLDQADCARASGCHLVFTSDERCNSLCCAPHFASCASGATANCDALRSGPCGGSCALPQPTCDSPFVAGYYDDGCCPVGCIAISQCARITTAPSSQCVSGVADTLSTGSSACDPGALGTLGPQGCPPQ